MPKISEAHRQAVRQRVLDAAQRLVTRRGLHETSMDDIVRESGLSKGAIYGHFASKEELLLALQDRTLESRIREVTDRFQPADSVRARVRSLLAAALAAGARADRDRLRLNLEFLVAALRTRSLQARVDARYARSHQLFRDLLEEGRGSGEVRPDVDPDVTAAALVALLDGISLHRALTTRVPADWRTLLSVTERSVFDGIGTQPGRHSKRRARSPAGARP